LKIKFLSLLILLIFSGCTPKPLYKVGECRYLQEHKLYYEIIGFEKDHYSLFMCPKSELKNITLTECHSVVGPMLMKASTFEDFVTIPILCSARL